MPHLKGQTRMNNRLTRSELQQALIYLFRREDVRSYGRIVLVALVLIAIGLIGPWLMRRVPPPSITLRDQQLGCTFAAQIAGDPTVVPPPAPVHVESQFEATWFIINTGSCAWDDKVTFRHVEGPVAEVTPRLSVPDFKFNAQPGPQPIEPGATFAPIVFMTSPLQSGVYVNTWRLFHNDAPFGPLFAFSVQAYRGAPPTTVLNTAPLTFDIWFVFPAILGVFLAIFQGARFVAQMYSLKSMGHALEFIIAAAFGVGGTTVVVKGGEVEGLTPPPAPSKIKVVVKPPDNEAGLQIGGPGTLSIKSSNAVVTERGSYFARMLGPGDHILPAFERVRNVVDLRQIAQSSTEVALTKDGIPVRADVNTTIKIMPHIPNEVDPPPPPASMETVLRHLLGRRARPTAPQPLPASPEALRMATYEVHANPTMKISWFGSANSAVTGDVRDAMASRLLDNIFAPEEPSANPRQDIAQRLDKSGKELLAKRGIDLVGSGFGNITVPPEVTEQRHRNWQVFWDKESAIAKSDGEAEGILQRETARAEAQVEFIQAVVQAIRTNSQTVEPGEAAHPLSLRFMDDIARAVVRALRNASNRMTSEKEFNTLLDQLRKALDTRSLNR